MSSNTQEEEHFFKDLDARRAHQSCCTGATLVLFFLFLFLILACATFYVDWQVTHVKFLPLRMPPSPQLASLIDKTNWLKPNLQGEVTINLTDQELGAILNDGISFDNFIFKNIRAQITPTKIIVTGLIKPFNLQTEIEVSPVVKNNQIDFEVTGIKTQKFNLPDFATQKLAQNLNDFMNAKLAIIYDRINVNEINLSDANMQIKGNAK